MRLVILDTETTGLDPQKGNRIIEIGCVEILNRTISTNPESFFHKYINPQRDSEEGALAIHGISTAFLADKPLFGQIVDDFIAYIKDATVIIHNADFDVRFLNAEFSLLGLAPFSTYCAEIIDSLQVAKEQFPGKRNNLDTLCDRFQVNRKQRVLHGALLDSQLLAEVWLALTRGQDSLLDADPEPPMVSGEPSSEWVEPMADLPTLPLYVLEPTDIEAHVTNLADIEKSSKKPPIWASYVSV